MAAAFRLLMVSLFAQEPLNHTCFLNWFPGGKKGNKNLGTECLCIMWRSEKGKHKKITPQWCGCKFKLHQANINKVHGHAAPHRMSWIKLHSQGVGLWEKKKQLGKDNSMLNVSLYSLFYRRWDEHYGVYKLAEQYRKIQFNHMKLFYSKTEKLHIGNAFNTEGQDPQLTSSSFHWTLPVYPSWRSAP